MLNVLRNKLSIMFMVLSISMLATIPAFAQSDTLNVDTGAFISAINDWFPMAISIVTIGVGISGAFALALFVGRMILGALNGRM